MTRGEAPGGSRPGAGAIRLGGWMGIATALLAGALTPHPHGLTGGAQQKPVGNRQRHSWGWLAVVHGRETEKTPPLLFLVLPRSASALLGRAFFLHYHPPYGWGVIMWLWGAIITLSPTHSRRAKRAYAQPALFVLRTDAERREARTR